MTPYTWKYNNVWHGKSGIIWNYDIRVHVQVCRTLKDNLQSFFAVINETTSIPYHKPVYNTLLDVVRELPRYYDTSRSKQYMFNST